MNRRKIDTGLREGTVTMPLREYDKMNQQLEYFRTMFSLEKYSWDDSIRVMADIKKVREIGLLLLEQGDFVKEEYELTEAETGTASILSIANMNKGKSNEE